MPDNYTTFEKVGSRFVGVFTIDGMRYVCQNKHNKKGIAVSEAARIRKSVIAKLNSK